MFVLENHFEDKPTILIHNRIINGCQDFTLEEAESILPEYGVSLGEWQQVLDVYTGTSTDEQIMQFIEHPGSIVRAAIAQYGNDEHRNLLVNDSSWYVCYIVAKYGNDEHRNLLINHEDWMVQMEARKI